MAGASITPIQEEHLQEVGRFLHDNLNQRISAAAWIASLTHHWSEVRPNYGMQLRDGSRLVGVLCAIYSDQMIAERMEKFCNPHSWCVLADYRRHSIGLVLSIIKQRGYHYTMLTPNAKVAEIFRQLRFRDLGEQIALFPNIPTFRAARGAVLEARRDMIGSHLPPSVRRDFELHQDIPWLRFLAFGREGDTCLVVYKAGRWKRMRSARILHVSDPAAFRRHRSLMTHYLLVREGFVTSSVETRFIRELPPLAHCRSRTQAKLFLSPTLNDSQITDLYSELAALDI